VTRSERQRHPYEWQPERTDQRLRLLALSSNSEGGGSDLGSSRRLPSRRECALSECAVACRPCRDADSMRRLFRASAFFALSTWRAKFERRAMKQSYNRVPAVIRGLAPLLNSCDVAPVASCRARFSSVAASPNSRSKRMTWIWDRTPFPGASRLRHHAVASRSSPQRELVIPPPVVSLRSWSPAGRHARQVLTT
jgi:hypothetical protein